MTEKIRKIMRPGDYIYSANGGEPLKVEEITSVGLVTDEDFFSYEEHGSLYFLTERGYKDSLIKETRNEKHII